MARKLFGVETSTIHCSRIAHYVIPPFGGGCPLQKEQPH
jgi:hypothetical protein